MLIFTLSKPIKTVLSGAHGPRREENIGEITMRMLDTKDLPILEEHRRQPVSLAMHLVANLSGLTLAQVKKLAIEDFSPIGAAALEQVPAVSKALGLAPDYFFHQTHSTM
jgi:hypothetical protein